MADLKTLCIDGECMNIPEGSSGSDVTGVKGQQESSYRNGNVNISPNNVLYLGANITGGVANDTKAFWNTKTSGYAYFNTDGQLNGQPNRYGFLEHLSYVSGISFQTFHAVDGYIYHRFYTGASPELTNWVKLAPTNSPAFTGTPTAPTNGTASDSSTQIATDAFVQNAITRRLPKSQNVSANVGSYSVANTTFVQKDLYTAPSNGLIIATLQVQWAANSTGYRMADIFRSGSGTGVGSSSPASNTGSSTQCDTIVRRLSSGDKLTSRVYQNSGAALNVSSQFFIGYFIPD